MPNTELPIMIVDDTRFSGAIIGRTLKSAGFRDVRTAVSAPQALEMLEERPVNLLLADWLMPEMDGLELAARVRQFDEASNHFTYIILLTAREGDSALVQAFDEGVDDFINKSTMQQQLLPRVYAADRLSTLHNQLLAENQVLLESNQRLRRHSLLDPLTGLGNARLALERVDTALRHTQSRGGATALLVIRIENYAALESQFGKKGLREVLLGTSRRLRQLVRPIDVVARVSNQDFAIVTHHSDVLQANSGTFRRIYDAINLRALKTSQGFINVKATLSMVVANEKTGFPDPEVMLSFAREKLADSKDTGRVLVTRWQQASTAE